MSRQFHGSFKDGLRKFQGWLKKVLSVFQENSKNVSSVSLAIRAEEGLVFVESSQNEDILPIMASFKEKGTKCVL